MNRIQIALCTALALGPAPLHAQRTDYYALLGATWSSTLLTDRIVNDIEVQQGIAPTIRAGVSFPIASRYGAGVEGGFGSSSYKAKELDSTTDLGSLSTVSITANLDGPVIERLRWRAGLGVLGYLETSDGIFQEGGPWKALFMAGVDYRIPFRPSWDIEVGLRVDTHGFNTSALEAQEFTTSQRVGRIFLGVGLARTRS
jgi:hypothetical protein